MIDTIPLLKEPEQYPVEGVMRAAHPSSLVAVIPVFRGPVFCSLMSRLHCTLCMLLLLFIPPVFAADVLLVDDDDNLSLIHI